MFTSACFLQATSVLTARVVLGNVVEFQIIELKPWLKYCEEVKNEYRRLQQNDIFWVRSDDSDTNILCLMSFNGKQKRVNIHLTGRASMLMPQLSVDTPLRNTEGEQRHSVPHPFLWQRVWPRVHLSMRYCAATRVGVSSKIRPTAANPSQEHISTNAL